MNIWYEEWTRGCVILISGFRNLATSAVRQEISKSSHLGSPSTNETNQTDVQNIHPNITKMLYNYTIHAAKMF